MALTKVTSELIDFGDLDLSDVGEIALDAIKGDADSNTSITFSGSDVITIANAGTNQVTFNDGAILPVTNNDIDLGSDALEFKNAWFDGTLEADAITVGGSNISTIYSAIAGSSSIVTTGALNSGSITSGFGTIDTGSSAITTTGLISGGSLDIDNVLINGTTIGHTDDTDLITLADGIATVAGEVSMTTLDIGGTNVTSTAAELNILDGATVVVGEINALDLGSTAVGTAIASKAVILDSNKDYTGLRNLTITGELDAATLDVSGNVDIDGTLETDNLTIGDAQGSDGQVLTSTGSGVAWEDAGGGGASDIDGLSDAKSGGTDFASSLIIGHQTTGTLSAASYNTAVGYGAFDAVTLGGHNTCIGYNSLTSNTFGHMNTAVGFAALSTTVTNLTDEQTAVGFAALELSVGEKNTAVGCYAGQALTSGTLNTLIGWDAGNAAMEQDYNTCVGAIAGTALTTGAGFNTGVGKSALAGATTSNYVVAVGTNAAGGGVLTGNALVAVGHNAGYSLTAATNSVFVGQGAGESVTDGISNTAVGMDSLAACVGAGYNTCVGQRAGYAVTGQRNTLMGYYAGAGITSGAYNTIVGSTCYQSAADGNYQMIFGYDVTSVGDSTMTIGKGSNTCSISLDGSDTSWAAASDIRLKDNIEDSLAGLDFINELRPITYKWKLKKDVPTDMFEYEDSDEPCKGTGKTNHGFIAQEVKAIIDKYDSVKDGNNIWDVADSGTENVAPSALIPMLVKAVQELSAEVEELKKEKNNGSN